MKNRTKMIVAICGAILLLGVLLSVSTHLHRNRSAGAAPAASQRLDTTTKHEETVELDAVQNIDIDIENADIEFVASDHFALYHCYYGNYYEFYYEQQGDTLRVWDKANQQVQIRTSGFNFFGITFNSESGIFFDGETKPNQVKLYYPEDTRFDSVVMEASYGDVKIPSLGASSAELRLSSGDGSFREIYADSLRIVNSYGDVSFLNSRPFEAQEAVFDLSSGDLKVENLSAGEFSVNDSYGDVKLKKLGCTDLKVQMSSGDLRLDELKAGTASLSNSYGEVYGSDVTISTSLSVDASSGDVELSGSLPGRSKIHASYGDVRLRLAQKRGETGYDLLTSYGAISVDGERQKDDEGEDSSHVSGSGGPAAIEVSCSSGDVELDFRQ